MSLEHIAKFRSVLTGREWSAADALEQRLWLDPDPALGLDGILAIEYDLDRVAAGLRAWPLAERPVEGGHWRYRELLPIRGDVAPPPLAIGSTPMVEAPRLAAHIGIARVWLKDDGRNPTGSLKDRPSSLAVVKAMEEGATAVACASTGNAASSLAGFAAAAGLEATIFVPKRAPIPKVTQLVLYGAKVYRVDADYDTTWQLCQKVCPDRGWYNRNCAVNPYLVEGKKTCGLEIAEQSARLGVSPDWVVASVGDGCSIAAIGKGLDEMHQLGILAGRPRLLGTQAVGADPITRAFDAGAERVEPMVDAATVADSICVGRPANGNRGLMSVRDSGGAYVSVEDDATLEALRLLPRLTGHFGEPAAVNALAGLIEARQRGVVGPNDTAVIVLSGHGLKDTATASRAAGDPIDIPADPAAVA